MQRVHVHLQVMLHDVKVSDGVPEPLECRGQARPVRVPQHTPHNLRRGAQRHAMHSGEPDACECTELVTVRSDDSAMLMQDCAAPPICVAQPTMGPCE